MSIGRCVFTPWPMSGFFATSVTTPLAAIVMNADAVSAGLVTGICAKISATGSK